MVREVSYLVRGRYAPSPTGTLHLGNLRTALLAWLFARCSGGQFVLRIEDLDRPRVRAGAAEQMLEDLRWLGLDWDEGPNAGGFYAPYTQSERLDLYEEQLRSLVERGLVYPCYCSRAEIARVASAPHGDKGPRYPGTCRQLTEVQRRRYVSEGRQPALRLRVDDERNVTFDDLIVGPTTQWVQQNVGDFIVRRSDGVFAYQFAVVVDDGIMRVNQVVRGADLLSSTARQILLFEASGFPVPVFAHVPLWMDDHGQRLSKRVLSAGLDPLRTRGVVPSMVVGELAASCGLLGQGERISAGELVELYRGNDYAIIRTKLSKDQI